MPDTRSLTFNVHQIEYTDLNPCNMFPIPSGQPQVSVELKGFYSFPSCHYVERPSYWVFAHGGRYLTVMKPGCGTDNKALLYINPDETESHHHGVSITELDIPVLLTHESSPQHTVEIPKNQFLDFQMPGPPTMLVFSNPWRHSELPVAAYSPLTTLLCEPGDDYSRFYELIRNQRVVRTCSAECYDTQWIPEEEIQTLQLGRYFERLNRLVEQSVQPDVAWEIQLKLRTGFPRAGRLRNGILITSHYLLSGASDSNVRGFTVGRSNFLLLDPGRDNAFRLCREPVSRAKPRTRGQATSNQVLIDA